MTAPADSPAQDQQQEEPSRAVPFVADENSGRPFSLLARSERRRLHVHATASSSRKAVWGIPPQHDRSRLGRLDSGPGIASHIGQYWSLDDATLADQYTEFGDPGETSIYPPFSIRYLANGSFNRFYTEHEPARNARWEVEHKCKCACERLLFVQNAVIHDGVTDLSAARLTWLAPTITDGIASEYDHRKTRPYSHTGDIPAWDPITFVEDWGNNLALCYYHPVRAGSRSGYRSEIADDIVRSGEWPAQWPDSGRFLLYRNQYRQPFEWLWDARGGYYRSPVIGSAADEAYVRSHFETLPGKEPAPPGSDTPEKDIYIQKLIHWRPVSYSSDYETAPLNAREGICDFIKSSLPQILAQKVSIRQDTAFDLAIHADNYNVYTWHRLNALWKDAGAEPWKRDDWKWIKGTSTQNDYRTFYVSRLDIWFRQLSCCPPLNWPQGQEGGAP